MDKSTSFIKLEWSKVCNLSAETIDSIEKERGRTKRLLSKHRRLSRNLSKETKIK